jgi:hypothetical protein
MNCRRKILVVVGIILGVAILLPVVRHYQLRAATEAYIAELKAKGEPMDLTQVIPPPVPTEQNGALIFLKAAALLGTNWNVLGSNPPPAMRMTASGKAMVGWQLPVIRDGRASNSWAEVEAALAQENAALVLLRQITTGRVFDFKLDFSNGLEKIQLPQLASAKKAAQRLIAAAMNNLHRGDAAAAAENIRATLAVVQGMSHDRLVISELVRMAIAQMALAANWELLQSTNITDEQLAAVQKNWLDLEFIHAEERALELERVTGQISLAEWRSSNAALRRYADMWEDLGLQSLSGSVHRHKNFFEKLKINVEIYLWRFWWSYPDELRALKGGQIMLETTRTAETNYFWLAAWRKQEAELNVIAKDTGSFWFAQPDKADFHSVASSDLKSMGNVFNRVMKVEAARQLTVTAIALKRFQLQHGNFPEKLSELTPEFLASVPLDPVDGQPLRYLRNTDGTFLLYSIGDDGVDDGGNPKPSGDSQSLQWQRGRDWVWPQPATPAEVQFFYDHPPK